MSCPCGKTFPYRVNNESSRKRALKFLKLHRQKCTVNDVVIPKKFTDIAKAFGCSETETSIYYRQYRDNGISTSYEVHIKHCQQYHKLDHWV
jgi:hypothetical protein